MAVVFVLMLVACAGSIYGAYVMKKERERRATDVIRALENQDAEVPAPMAGIRRFLPSSMLATYDQKLLWVGRPYGLDGSTFVGVKVVAAVGLPLLISLVTLFQLGSMAVLVIALGAFAGFILPDVWLGAKLGARRQQVAEELPLFADLIATAVSAGLPLTEAVRRVSADAPGLVAREFLRAVQEMAAGKPRAQAWRDLIDRVPGEDLRVIVNAIMQAEQYGTSVSDIIRYQVQQIRLLKQQDAQRIAQATTVKMRIPMRVVKGQKARACHPETLCATIRVIPVPPYKFKNRLPGWVDGRRPATFFISHSDSPGGFRRADAGRPDPPGRPCHRP